MPFPRIIRSEDYRGKSPKDDEYLSPLAKFLINFSKYAKRNDIPFVPFSRDDNTDQTDEVFRKEAKKIKDSYNSIKKLIKNIGNHEGISIDRPGRGHHKYKELFNQLDDRQHAINKIQSCPEIHDLIRVMLFSSYLSRCVVLARIVIKDEDAAFDIFDALNSTGQPLTAIETLRPIIMQYEKQKKGYKGSPSQYDMDRIGKVLDPLKPHKRERETKELIILFALYITGEKVDGKPSGQRSFLRRLYDQSKKKNSSNTDYPRKFISSIADLNDFKKEFWPSKKEKLPEIGSFGSEEDTNTVKLCIALIRGMNTSLALPILARYWKPNLKERKRFLNVIKIVTAFLVLRRAATGGTDGIDGDFRSIMAPTGGDGNGLCIGIKHDNELLSPKDLRAAFKTQLKNKKLDIRRQSKSQWVDRVTEQPLYEYSQDLVRFLILAAADQSQPSGKVHGTWEREDVRPSTHNSFLNYATWTDNSHDSIEHIAPVSGQSTSLWDQDIYRHNLHHSLGNLILLPKTLNCAVQDSGWQKKRIIYRALTEKSEHGKEDIMSEATAENDAKLSEFIEGWLSESKCLDLLTPLRNVDDWNLDIVKKRSRNTATLAWETISPWLFVKGED